MFVENDTANFGQAVDDLGDLIVEHVADVLHRVLGVLHHIVQQSAADGGRAEAHLVADDTGDGQRVHDVGLPGPTAYALVGLVGEVEGLRDTLDFASVVRVAIVIDQAIEFVLNHLVFGLGPIILCIHNGEYEVVRWNGRADGPPIGD